MRNFNEINKKSALNGTIPTCLSENQLTGLHKILEYCFLNIGNKNRIKTEKCFLFETGNLDIRATCDIHFFGYKWSTMLAICVRAIVAALDKDSSNTFRIYLKKFGWFCCVADNLYRIGFCISAIVAKFVQEHLDKRNIVVSAYLF